MKAQMCQIFKNILCNHFRCQITFVSITVTFNVLWFTFVFLFRFAKHVRFSFPFHLTKICPFSFHFQFRLTNITLSCSISSMLPQQPIVKLLLHVGLLAKQSTDSRFRFQTQPDPAVISHSVILVCADCRASSFQQIKQLLLICVHSVCMPYNACKEPLVSYASAVAKFRSMRGVKLYVGLKLTCRPYANHYRRK